MRLVPARSVPPPRPAPVGWEEGRRVGFACSGLRVVVRRRKRSSPFLWAVSAQKKGLRRLNPRGVPSYNVGCVGIAAARALIAFGDL